MKIKDLLKDIEDVDLTPEQEKQIKDYLGIKESKRWKPKKYDNYYFIMGDGVISKIIFNPAFNVDNGHLHMNNYFKTIEEAEFALKKYEVYMELKNFADDYSEPIDWNDNLTDKYCIVYSHNNQKLFIHNWSSAQYLNQIYFSSSELAEQAIEKVGADRIEKYLFGVK